MALLTTAIPLSQNRHETDLFFFLSTNQKIKILSNGLYQNILFAELANAATPCVYMCLQIEVPRCVYTKTVVGWQNSSVILASLIGICTYNKKVKENTSLKTFYFEK